MKQRGTRGSEVAAAGTGRFDADVGAILLEGGASPRVDRLVCAITRHAQHARGVRATGMRPALHAVVGVR